MEGILTGIFMSFSFLVLLLFRKKKYGISTKLMVILHILFSITGMFGASLGAFLSGLTWAGKRLHMLMVVDAITLTVLCKLTKKDESYMGDYLAIPIISVCAAAKVGCLLTGCCYGIEFYSNIEGRYIIFPSQAFELTLWISLMIWLLTLEKKGNSKGLLWPLALIWFGIIRYLVDFLRGSPNSKIKVLLNLTYGQLYSLVALGFGLVYLYIALKNKKDLNVGVKEYLSAILGKNK